MNLTIEQQKILHALIAKLYASPFNELLIRNISSKICDLIDANYFGLTLLSGRSVPHFIDNNPRDFVPIYFSVANEDFLMDSIISNHRDCILQNLYAKVLHEPDKQNFINTVQTARPISDIAYLPVVVNGNIAGHWAFGRAGLKSPVYSQDQLELLRFMSLFVNDAFQRSLIPPPLEDEVAYLDYRGNIIGQGVIIKEAFDRLFGKNLILTNNPSHNDLRTVFRKSFATFINGNFKVGVDTLVLRSLDFGYNFLFSVLNPENLQPHVKGIPIASVRLLSREGIKEAQEVIDWQRIVNMYSFTPKEEDIALKILKGKMNKEIAYDLGIDEGTVKWHTHSIYEKTGFRSRTQLVIGLTQTGKTN
jgi:DNA-binding NarL/FixJ family response regulator